MKRKGFVQTVLSSLTLIFLLTGMANAGLKDGLVAYYPFNGNANDESGNGNHCSVYGATLATDMFGNPDVAYSFNGINNYLEKISPTGVLNIGNQSWTISMWILMAPEASLGQVAVIGRYECGWDCTQNAMALWEMDISNSGNPMFYVRSDNMEQMQHPILTSNYNIRDGLWHHVVAMLVRDISLLTIFIDGVQQGVLVEPALSTVTDDKISPLEIGRFFRRGWGSPSEYFKGKLDDIRIYNRTLSDSEIQNLYLLNLDSDNDGVSDALDRCPNSRPGSIVDSNGCEQPECLSQEQLDQAVANAIAVKDQEIAALKATIASMYTKEQLDQTSADAQLSIIAIDLTGELRAVFKDPNFEISGATAIEKITNLANAIGNLPKGQIDKLYSFLH